MTYILAIDTTLGACSAAILQDQVVVGQLSEDRLRGHVERLLPMIDEVCTLAQVDISEIDYIALSQGPGTFAGVRIGLSAAKGLGLALNIPLITVTTLKAIAYQYLLENEGFKGCFAVAIDARRGEVYLECFKAEGGDCQSLTEPLAVPIDQVENKLTADIGMIIGSGTAAIKGVLKNNSLDLLDGYYNAQASMIGKLAATMINSARLADDVTPLYLRAPDAIMPKRPELTIIDE